MGRFLRARMSHASSCWARLLPATRCGAGGLGQASRTRLRTCTPRVAGSSGGRARVGRGMGRESTRDKSARVLPVQKRLLVLFGKCLVHKAGLGSVRSACAVVILRLAGNPAKYLPHTPRVLHPFPPSPQASHQPVPAALPIPRPPSASPFGRPSVNILNVPPRHPRACLALPTQGATTPFLPLVSHPSATPPRPKLMDGAVE